MLLSQFRTGASQLSVSPLSQFALLWCFAPLKQFIFISVAFSYGHWTFSEKAHGYKREKLEEWRELSKLGNQTTDRHALPEQATLDKIYQGKGDLKDIDMSWPTVEPCFFLRGRPAQDVEFTPGFRSFERISCCSVRPLLRALHWKHM